VTQAREAAATMEATRVIVALATETSAQEAAAAWDSVAILIKDVEDRVALALKRGCQEWRWRMPQC
jgi:hypothetical protein